MKLFFADYTWKCLGIFRLYLNILSHFGTICHNYMCAEPLHSSFERLLSQPKKKRFWETGYKTLHASLENLTTKLNPRKTLRKSIDILQQRVVLGCAKSDLIVLKISLGGFISLTYWKLSYWFCHESLCVVFMCQGFLSNLNIVGWCRL